MHFRDFSSDYISKVGTSALCPMRCRRTSASAALTAWVEGIHQETQNRGGAGLTVLDTATLFLSGETTSSKGNSPDLGGDITIRGS